MTENETRDQAVQRLANQALERAGDTIGELRQSPLRPFHISIATHPTTHQQTIVARLAFSLFEQEGITPGPVGAAGMAIKIDLAECGGDVEIAREAAMLGLQRAVTGMLMDTEFLAGVKVVDILKAMERARHQAKVEADRARDKSHVHTLANVGTVELPDEALPAPVSALANALREAGAEVKVVAMGENIAPDPEQDETKH